MASSRLVAARTALAAKNKLVIDLETRLKEARAERTVLVAEVVKEVAREAKAKLVKVLPPKVVAPAKTTKVRRTVKEPAAVCVPFAPAKRGRPVLSGCNACRRKDLGFTSYGKGHTCGKTQYAR